MPEPTLTPLAPTPGDPVRLGSVSPAWIGSAADAAIPLSLPSVSPRHVALVEREDGWWASVGSGPTSLNGRQLAGMTRLQDGDILEVAPGYRYEFSLGAAPAVAVPLVTRAPAAGTKPRSRRPPRAPGSRPPLLLIATVALAIVLVAGAATAIWFAAFRSDKSAALLTDEQAQRFDSLLVVAYDHVERGNTLLELGLPDVAAQEFARAVNTLALSDLRNHPAVKPRIEALEASVAAIYRDRKLTVPPSYANARSALPPDRLRQASLTPPQFAGAFAEVATAFQQRFGAAIGITGRDHAEHLSLYGAGGALDLRSRSMTPEEVRFVVAECRNRGIRVKDFSQDSILQRQIAAATRAGLLDRAGTGLHLHIDRFANRRDRWTVSVYMIRNLRREALARVNSSPS